MYVEQKERQQEEKVGEAIPYCLPGNNNGTYTTCKHFFLNPQDISDMVVRKCLDNLAGVDVVSRSHVTPDKTTEAKLDEVSRSHVTPNKTTEAKLDEVKTHIN